MTICRHSRYSVLCSLALLAHEKNTVKRGLTGLDLFLADLEFCDDRIQLFPGFTKSGLNPFEHFIFLAFLIAQI